MRYLIILLPLYLILSISDLAAQSSSDSTAIRNTALDYIEGWYAGEEERMERAIHPRLAKRLVTENPQQGNSNLVVTSALELFQQTRRGGGKMTPENDRKTDVKILDIYGNAASVKVDAGGWIDYMHMARWNGEWKIINVLWELNPQNK